MTWDDSYHSFCDNLVWSPFVVLHPLGMIIIGLSAKRCQENKCELYATTATTKAAAAAAATTTTTTTANTTAAMLWVMPFSEHRERPSESRTLASSSTTQDKI